MESNRITMNVGESIMVKNMRTGKIIQYTYCFYGKDQLFSNYFILDGLTGELIEVPNRLTINGAVEIITEHIEKSINMEIELTKVKIFNKD